MSEQQNGLIDFLAVILLLYVFFVIMRELLPLVLATGMGQEILEGTMQAVLFIAVATTAYFIAKYVLE